MNYPRLLQRSDTIGICAPSSGAPKDVMSKRLNNAISNIKALGYRVAETASVRSNIKCVSADSSTRASEFMSLYENPDIAAILPPWGGEFLMDILPLLDFEKLASLPAKWVCGYSDVTTLTFPMTIISDIATIHGSNLMNMGFARIHDADLRAFDVMSTPVTEQKSWDTWGGYTSWDDFSQDVYTLDKPSSWKSLQEDVHASFTGRMIGGCMDTLCKLIGTRFAPVDAFLEKYRHDGFIWTLESCEMTAPDIYRTFWQMREAGWFKYCNGILIGRPDGYKDKRDFTLIDALRQGLGSLKVPVIYDADVGHIPPQMQIINGSLGRVEYSDGKATVTQSTSKPLQQETPEERRTRIYPVVLSEYNPVWTEWYAEEKAIIQRLVGEENIARISHYGSTSVPGLVAKPTVDILLEINEDTDLNKLTAALAPPEYICLNEKSLTVSTPPPHLMFLKGYMPDGFAEKVYHVHVRYPGDPDELYFRDYLIAHPEVAAEYAALKNELYNNFRYDRDGYTNAKTAFIRAVTKKARKENTVL